MKLSIITVCFNSEKTIERTIKSVISQKKVVDDLEYIIIDGGSKDQTLEIIEKYKDEIGTIVSEKDNGISNAFNKGIRAATGDIVGIINSDDQYIHGCLKYINQEFSKNIDILFGNGMVVYEDGKYKPFYSKKSPEFLKLEMSMFHPAVFIKKAAYYTYGLFNEEFKCVMDRELLLRMYCAGAKFRYSNHFFAVYQSGGVSEQQYLKVVVNEEYKINISSGMKKNRAIYLRCRAIFFFNMVKIRNLFGFDKKRMSREEVKDKLNVNLS